MRRVHDWVSKKRCTQVASPGPPCVIARISSNTANAKAVRSTRITAITGRSIGRVTCQKRRQAVAPSTAAAS